MSLSNITPSSLSDVAHDVSGVDVIDVVRSRIDRVDLDGVSDVVTDATATALDTAATVMAATGEVSVSGGRLVRRVGVTSWRIARRHPQASITVGVIAAACVAGAVIAARRSGRDAESNAALSVAA